MRNLLKVIIFLLSNYVFAGNNDQNVGARSYGLAGNSIQFNDIWSTQNNPAGLGRLTQWGGGFSYENQFLIQEIATKSFIFAYPIKDASFGISFNQFGYSTYQENKIGLSYGQSLGKNLSMGVQLNYLSTQIGEGYGSRSALSGTIGLQANITDDLSLAAVVINPTNTKLAEFEDERYPVILKLGLGYTYSEKVQFLTEFVKDINFSPDLKLGIEYHAVDAIYFRVGYSTNPSLSSFGFGVEFNNFTLDFASGFNSNLGFSPQISLSYVPSKK